MKHEKVNEISQNDGVSDSRCPSTIKNKTANNEELSATHNLEKVDSEKQLKELAQVLSAGIEVHIRHSRYRGACNDSPLRSVNNQEVGIVNNYRMEFENLLKGFLNPKADDQRALINSLHRYIVGNDNAKNYQISGQGLEPSTIDIYFENYIRGEILTISQPMVFALFNNESPRMFDPHALFRVWFNQILAVTINCAASLNDQATSICIDCLSKEPLFQKVRKVVRDFVNQETQRASRLTKDKLISTKKLLKNLDPLVAQITESTFVELANELGSFSGNYIELRKPTENEIN